MSIRVTLFLAHNPQGINFQDHLMRPVGLHKPCQAGFVVGDGSWGLALNLIGPRSGRLGCQKRCGHQAWKALKDMVTSASLQANVYS